jgi:hypothetical protein
MNHVVERLEILQFGLDPVHRAHRLAAQPSRRLRECTGLVSHQHHDVLGLLGQPPDALERARHVVLEAVNHYSHFPDLARDPKCRDTQGNGHSQKGERQDRQRYRDGRSYPLGGRTGLQECQCPHKQ